VGRGSGRLLLVQNYVVLVSSRFLYGLPEPLDPEKSASVNKDMSQGHEVPNFSTSPHAYQRELISPPLPAVQCPHTVLRGQGLGPLRQRASTLYYVRAILALATARAPRVRDVHGTVGSEFLSLSKR
jgi:hypothetical protein